MTRVSFATAALVAILAAAAPAADRTIDELIDEARRTHWAYQPLDVSRPPSPPDAAGWASNEIDLYVLDRLAPLGVEPSSPADRRTLIRRVTLDLLGVPPTPDEVEDFVADPSPDAWSRLVDRLLASPRHGERWGRHWLDVARYADTKGYVFTQETRYAYSYTYRDWVIGALNADLPYDRFVLAQIAADRLEPGSDRRSLAALGFLTLGRRFSNRIHDIIDDRIDVVTRGLLGLTVTCSRCHDHKYDPISQRDYYALYGVFASSVEPDEPPLLDEPGSTPDYAKYAAELAARRQKVDDYLAAEHEKFVTSLRERASDYFLAAALGEELDAGEAGLSFGKDDLRPSIVRRAREALERAPESSDHVLAPFWKLTRLPAAELAARAPALLEELRRAGAINAAVDAALAAAPPSTVADVAARYGELFRAVDAEWRELRATDAGASGLPDPAREAVRQRVHGPQSLFALSIDESKRYLSRAVKNRLRELEREVDELRVTHPAAPPRAMALVDAPKPHDPRVFVRGDPNRPGDSVSRRYLAVLSEREPPSFTDGSGRLELAREITGRSRHLLARVMANRIWLHHFGEGLVRTPGDFGVRGSPPSHPRLLDRLAHRFIDGGWSMKQLHRLVLHSSAYRQASDLRAEALSVDAESTMLWRARRRRLEFEALRDSLLAVSGELDPTMGGRAVELTSRPSTRRRAVYGFIDRQDLPGLLRSFDFASPDASCPRRHETTVPQQALFLMNSDFVREQAAALVRRPEVVEVDDTRQRIDTLYRLAYGRPADADEITVGERYIASAPEGSDGEGVWARYAQVLLMANEFVFVD